MHLAVQHVKLEIEAGNRDITLPADAKIPGSGTTFWLTEFFGKHMEIIDLRCAMLNAHELQWTVYPVEGGFDRAESILKRTLSNPGNKPKLVILDEFDHAHPNVQDELNSIIKQVQENEHHIFFVKR